MSKQHESPSVVAERAYKAGEQTVDIIEQIEKTVAANAFMEGHDWNMQTGRFLWHLFWAKERDSGQAYPSFATVRDAMLSSTYTGHDAWGDHWDEAQAPIGSVHWYQAQYGAAALDMGPMGLITTGRRTDSRFGTNLGFISRAQMAQDHPYLGWSLTYADADPLVLDPVVFRTPAGSR